MTIVKNQGGANKAKEDAAVDAAFARAEAHPARARRADPARGRPDAGYERGGRRRPSRGHVAPLVPNMPRFVTFCHYSIPLCPGHWESSKTP